MKEQTHPVAAQFNPDLPHAGTSEWKAAILAMRLCLHLPKLDAFLMRHADSFLDATQPCLQWSKKASSIIRELLREAEANPLSYEGAPRLDLDREAAERVIAWMGKRHPAILKDSLQSSLKRCELEQDKTLQVTTNVRLLAELLALSNCQAKLVEHAGLVATVAAYRSLMRSVAEFSTDTGIDYLATMVCEDADAVARALRRSSTIVAYDLVKTDDSPRDLEDMVTISTAGSPLFREQFTTIEELKNYYLKPCPPSTLTAMDFSYLKGAVEHIARYLLKATAHGVTGINILLHGAPGTGKSELARVITESAGFKAYLVPGADNEGEPMKGSQRLGSFGLIQKFLFSTDRSLVIFDEVEDVFPDNSIASFTRVLGISGKNTKEGKAWTNELLENSSTPSIWIANTTDGIDPAYLRRFHFHLEVKVPPTAVRRQIATSTLQRWGDGKVIPGLVDFLTEDSSLSIASMESAIRYGINAAENEEEIPLLVRTAVAQHRRAAGQNYQHHQPRRNCQPFDTAYLNIDAGMSIEALIPAMEKQQGISLCFYGPPGTGKTSLAEHISEQLHRPLIVRLGSDLLGKYVGESEKAIASMFAEASDENAILLLDECDSFLASRSRARNNWEITQTNELLQQMERHQGIFICATNRFEDLDVAVLRRLALKINFKPLTLDQRVRLFAQEVLDGDVYAANQYYGSRLAKLADLTPGDYSAVRARLRLAGNCCEAEKYLEELAEEIAVKNNNLYGSRPIGFI